MCKDKYSIGDIVIGGHPERKGVIINILEDSTLVIEIDTTFNEYKGWSNNGDKDIPVGYKPIFSNRYSLLGPLSIESHIKKSDIKSEFKLGDSVIITNPGHCYSNADTQARRMGANKHKVNKQLNEGDIVTISAIDTERVGDGTIIYLLTSQDGSQYIYNDKGFIKYNKVSNTFQVGDYVKYKSGKAIYKIDGIVGDNCYIIYIINKNRYNANINQLEYIGLEDLNILNYNNIEYCYNFNSGKGIVDYIEILSKDGIKEIKKESEDSNEYYSEFSQKPTGIINPLGLQGLKADFIDEAVGYNTLMKEAQKDFADAFAYSLENTLYNNTKPTMSTLSKIKTEEFFNNKKNVKVIEDTISELNRLEKSFNTVLKDLQFKIIKVNGLREGLDRAISNDDIKSIQEQLSLLKPRVEFLNRYEENTIKELGFTETKVTSPEEFFKS